MKTYIVQILDKTWRGSGENFLEGVLDAFRKIVAACHSNDAKGIATNVGLTYSVREEGRTSREAVDGYSTIDMLTMLGELSEPDGWILHETLKRNPKYGF